MIWQLIDSRGPGGAERHIATLVQSLSGCGVKSKVVLLADHGPNAWPVQLRQAGADVHHLDGRFGGLLGALRRDRPSLLHTHGYKAGILGRAAAVLCRVPVVSTFHSGEREPFPVSLYSRLDEWTSLVGQRVAVSPGVAKRLPFSANVIANYIATEPQPSAMPLPRRIAFVGRLSEECRRENN